MRQVGIPFRPPTKAPRWKQQSLDAMLDQVCVYDDPRWRNQEAEFEVPKMPRALKQPHPPQPLLPQVQQELHRSGYKNARAMMQRVTERTHDKKLEAKKSIQASAQVQGPKISAEEIKASFDNIDLNGDMSITAQELRQVFAQLGDVMTDVDLNNMITMADTTGQQKVTCADFQVLFSKPAVLFAQIDMSKLREPVDKELAIEQYFRAPGLKDAEKVEGIKPVKYDPALRESILAEFGRDGESHIRSTDLKKLCKRFQDVDEDNSGEIDYAEFCKFLGHPQDSLMARRIFGIFDIDGGGTVSLREFIVGLIQFTGASTNEVMKNAFDLYDEDRSGTIDEVELTKFISASFSAGENIKDLDVKVKVLCVYQSLGLKKGTELTLSQFLDAGRQNPHLFGPVRDLQMDVNVGFVAEADVDGDFGKDYRKATKQKEEAEASSSKEPEAIEDK